MSAPDSAFQENSLNAIVQTPKFQNSSDHNEIDNNKTTHSFESEDDDISPQVSKKRRTGSVSQQAAALVASLADMDKLIAQNQDDLEKSGDSISKNREGEPGHSMPADGDVITDDLAALTGPFAPVSDVITTIINQAEKSDGQNMNPQMPGPSDEKTRNQNLPILDNLTTQLLSLLAQSSCADLTMPASNSSSETAQAFSTVKSLFEHTRDLYVTGGPFLSADALGIGDAADIEIIRRANVASFISSLYGTHEISFSDLNRYFIDVFVPDGSRLLKAQAAIYLELKTQAVIAELSSNGLPGPVALAEFFPHDLEQQLIARKPGIKQLAPSEIDFVKRAHSRNDMILTELQNPNVVEILQERYRWESFLRDVGAYVSKAFENLSQSKKHIKDHQTIRHVEAEEPQQTPHSNHFPSQPSPPVASAGRSLHSDIVARAARAAQIALQGQGLKSESNRKEKSPDDSRQKETPEPPQQSQQMPVAQPPPPPTHYPPPQPPSSHSRQPPQITFQQQKIQIQQYNPQAGSRSHAGTGAYGYIQGVPHYSQSQPTQVLYERARLVASAKSSPVRRAGLPSQRRPWSTEEENALMAGLDRVKGPHWAQILAMFGPGGTINETLKDRNQVQLKDKARNLKLFFLKSGIEVPYYLKFVTGELKTRAPAQAAKQEARERERKRGEEDKAHVEGIEGMMALAGANAPSMSAEPGQDQPHMSPTPTGSNSGVPNNGVFLPALTAASTPPAVTMTHGPPPPEYTRTPEQAMEQALIQSLTQEARASPMQFEQQRPPSTRMQHPAVDPSMQ